MDRVSIGRSSDRRDPIGPVEDLHKTPLGVHMFIVIAYPTSAVAVLCSNPHPLEVEPWLSWRRH